MALEENIKAFIVHISFLSLRLRRTIHPIRKSQIALLLAKKVTILVKYSDFANIFLEKLANIVHKQTRANKHTIEIEQSKPLPYRPLYSLELIELETFKTYFMTNLANSFIRASKLLAGALIVFVLKSNISLRLCVNYRAFNNLTIKNRYLLLLIRESLD